MKLKALSIALLLSSAFAAQAATFHGPDKEFIGAAEASGVPAALWDNAEYAASTFPNAYKFTPSYKIKASGVAPEQFKKGAQLDFEKIQIAAIDGEMSLNDYLRDRVKNHSLVVLKGDKLLHEHYWNGMNETSTHLDMSVTKSFTAMLAGIAADQGKLDVSKQVTFYLPELKGTAWDGATVQETADMRTNVVQEIQKHKSWDTRMTDSQGWTGDHSATYPQGIQSYFPLVKEVSEPMGTKYSYQCINTEVLGKVVEAATGEKLADLLEQNFWGKVGMANDANYQADFAGNPVASGGLNAATKDLARVGRTLVNGGKNYKGEQVVPAQFIKDILAGNDKVRSAWLKGKESALAEGWYKDQFRVLNIGGRTIMAMVGIHGQILAMDHKTGTVVAMNGGYPQTETPRMAIAIFYQALPAIFAAADEVK
ncbi:serine hydrolase [Shewanella sp. WXL01]|uniref:serine hydrolase domain-containing protein n=1 Tax=Shewanella sp. WXL01 TaxID=2709721 RepID=UPI00143831B9|nr:serine hydrolase [Shewanella sp. WXL01]NKF49126.1 serine hydrolase [Shewanella sp. WXL01]